MAFNGEERKFLIKKLMAITTYTKENIEWFAKTDSQLYQIYVRIKQCVETYPREIAEFLQKYPNKDFNYTLDELSKMKYNELSAIRRKLHIRRKAQHVNANNYDLQKENQAQTVKQSHATFEEKFNEILGDDKEPLILNAFELMVMYPEEAESLNDEELLRMGIVHEEPCNMPRGKETLDPYIMAATIDEAGILVRGKKITFEDCLNMSLEEVKTLYHIAQNILNNEDGIVLTKRP